MKFIAFATIVALASACLVQTQAADCKSSTCPCNGHAPGLMCGDESPDARCLNGHIYQCNASGRTCDFGKRQSCVDCGRPNC